MGTRTVIECVAQGKLAAKAIDRYLAGDDMSLVAAEITEEERVPELIDIVPYKPEEPQVRMPFIDFLLGRCHEHVNQVIGFHAEALATRDLDVVAPLVLGAQFIAELGGTAGRERNHLIGKMCVVLSLVFVAKASQSFHYRALSFSLSGINDVVDFTDASEMGVVR